MLTFDIYTIYTIKQGYGRDCELFLTYEEAERARVRYSNEGMGAGDVYIRKYVNGKLSPQDLWHINAAGQVSFIGNKISDYPRKEDD